MLPYVPYMDPMILWVYINKCYIQFKPYGNWLMTMPSCGNVNNVLTTAWTTTVIRSLSLGKKEGFLCFSFLCWCCWRVRPPTIYYFFCPTYQESPNSPRAPTCSAFANDFGTPRCFVSQFKRGKREVVGGCELWWILEHPLSRKI